MWHTHIQIHQKYSLTCAIIHQLYRCFSNVSGYFHCFLCLHRSVNENVTYDRTQSFLAVILACGSKAFRWMALQHQNAYSYIQNIAIWSLSKYEISWKNFFYLFFFFIKKKTNKKRRLSDPWCHKRTRVILIWLWTGWVVRDSSTNDLRPHWNYLIILWKFSFTHMYLYYPYYILYSSVFFFLLFSNRLFSTKMPNEHNIFGFFFYRNDNKLII